MCEVFKSIDVLYGFQEEGRSKASQILDGMFPSKRRKPAMYVTHALLRCSFGDHAESPEKRGIIRRHVGINLSQAWIWAVSMATRRCY